MGTYLRWDQQHPLTRLCLTLEMTLYAKANMMRSSTPTLKFGTTNLPKQDLPKRDILLTTRLKRTSLQGVDLALIWIHSPKCFRVNLGVTPLLNPLKRSTSTLNYNLKDISTIANRKSMEQSEIAKEEVKTLWKPWHNQFYTPFRFTQRDLLTPIINKGENLLKS